MSVHVHRNRCSRSPKSVFTFAEIPSILSGIALTRRNAAREATAPRAPRPARRRPRRRCGSPCEYSGGPRPADSGGRVWPGRAAPARRSPRPVAGTQTARIRLPGCRTTGAGEASGQSSPTPPLGPRSTRRACRTKAKRPTSRRPPRGCHPATPLLPTSPERPCQNRLAPDESDIRSRHGVAVRLQNERSLGTVDNAEAAGFHVQFAIEADPVNSAKFKNALRSAICVA